MLSKVIVIHEGRFKYLAILRFSFYTYYLATHNLPPDTPQQVGSKTHKTKDKLHHGFTSVDPVTTTACLHS